MLESALDEALEEEPDEALDDCDEAQPAKATAATAARAMAKTHMRRFLVIFMSASSLSKRWIEHTTDCSTVSLQERDTVGQHAQDRVTQWVTQHRTK